MASRKKHRALRSRSIRYAVIGLGHIAQAAVLPAFKHAQRNSALAALVSGDPKKRQQLAKRYGVKRVCDYEDIDDLFESGEIDAVYIALPNDMHADYTIRAAHAGLHVLCEKPMAMTTPQCKAMIRATTTAGVKLMIAYRLHFERANLEAARAARSGALGDLRFFSSDFSMQVSEQNIRLKRSHGGGPLYDIGIYCINAARYCFGTDPVKVWASATRSKDTRFREVDETVCGTLLFEDEHVATFTCSFGAADRSIYTVTGTRGSVTVDPAYEYAEGLAYQIRIGERKRTRKFGKSDQFAPELLYFSDCILHDRTPEPSGLEGLADVRIIEGMQRSLRSHRVVSLAMDQRKRRPTLQQELRRPAVRREPRLINASSASQ